MLTLASSPATSNHLDNFAKAAKLLAVLAVLGASSQLCAQTYTPIATTGYNHDVIADGTGSAADKTSTGLDGDMDVDLDRYVLKSLDWKSSDGAAAQTSGLPVNGVITSANDPNLNYQLQAYSSNNSLRLTESGTGTLVLTNQSAYRRLSILATSGYGNSTFTAVVHFGDGTQTIFEDLSVADWYGGENYVLQGLGRVIRENDEVEDSEDNPRLYPVNIDLQPEDQSKAITELTITRTGSGDMDGEGDDSGILNVFALSGVGAAAPLTAAVPVPSLGHLALALLSLLAAGLGACGLRQRPSTLRNYQA